MRLCRRGANRRQQHGQAIPVEAEQAEAVVNDLVEAALKAIERRLALVLGAVAMQAGRPIAGTRELHGHLLSAVLGAGKDQH